MGVASDIVGIDNARETIDYLRKKHGIENILYGDVEALERFNLCPFDVVVAGELIEHLSNPGLFLEGIKRFISPEGLLLISTINAFCLRRFIRVAFGRESVHQDHKCYFSHSTLTRLLLGHGYRIEGSYTYRLPKRGPWPPYVVEWLSSLLSPNFVEGLVYVVRK